MTTTTTQPEVDEAAPRYVILPDLPLDVYEMPDPDTHALIAECPSEVQARQVRDALNQSPAIDAPTEALREIADAVPTSWLDYLLTGPTAVIGKLPYSGKDIEALLRAVKERVAEVSREALARWEGRGES